MKSFLKAHWPLIIILAALCIVTAIVLAIAVPRMNGNLVYAIDDPYIHMAIAKNLVNNGNWGPTPFEYASASSSILWTLLIASVYFIFGISELVPFILAFLSAVGLLYISYRIFRLLHVPHYLSFGILLLILFITPIIPMIFTGQEHLLHALIAIAVAYLATVTLIEADKKKQKRAYLVLIFITPLVTMVRYEGLFIIGIIVLLLLIRKRITPALLIIFAAFAPIIIHGGISVSNGGYFFPNSVLVKSVSSNLLSLSGFLEFVQYSTLIKNPYIALLIIVTLVLLLMKKGIHFWSTTTIFTVIAVGSVILHLEFVRIDWFGRYKAYLVALLVLNIGILLHELLPRQPQFALKKILTFKNIAAAALILIALSSHLVVRGYIMLRYLPQATDSIYLQQYQMARFINQYYDGESVALNDIGAVSYKSDIYLLDFFGLASNDVTQIMLNRKLNQEDIAQLSLDANIKLAIIYPVLFGFWKADMPSGWVRVGDWKNPANMTGLSDTVAFYAPNTIEEQVLIGNLCDFSAELPDGIIEKGKYLNDCDD